jgi:germination protein M
MAGRKTGKSRNIGTVVALAVAGFVVAAAVTYYVARSLQGGGPAGTAQVTTPPVVTLTEQRQVTLYLPKKSKNGLYLAAEARRTESKGSKLDAAMSALLEAGQQKGEAAGLIPDGTKLRSPIKVKDSIATVDLTKEFQENFYGGSDQEALTLNAIVHTLVSNSDGKVKRARILVEGEPAETLGGHFDLSEPISADSTLLKPRDED